MRRKQLQTNTQISGGQSDAPSSPSTGAMDALFEKLRAAAPAARDTRDRRRRARLKDKHQLRVASGQKIPETGENVDENGLLTPKTEGSEDAGSAEGGTSEGEDIADRAASLLQGLRRDGDGETPGRDDSLRVRRSREGADNERARRRERRRRGGAGAKTIAEEIETDETTTPAGEEAGEESKRSSEEGRDSGEHQLPTPTTIIVPPSPTVSETLDKPADEDQIGV